jgi:fermentation-respiration switch protein FrsA (DUF1100 family)
MMKTRLSFQSDGTRCAATLYRPTDTAASVPCVVMGHGFTGTQDQLAPYAERFAAAGLAVLTFDYRHFGASDGQPRQIVDVRKQLEDWQAAIGSEGNGRTYPDAAAGLRRRARYRSRS